MKVVGSQSEKRAIDTEREYSWFSVSYRGRLSLVSQVIGSPGLRLYPGLSEPSVIGHIKIWIILSLEILAIVSSRPDKTAEEQYTEGQAT